jgi:hypothetical protein
MVSLILSGAIAALGQSSPPPSLSCPSTLKVTETAAPLQGWKSVSTPKDHEFERVSIYNVDKEGREYDLAPDDQARTTGKIVQAWKLKDYRSMKIFHAAVITTPPWSYIRKRLLPSPNAPSHSL